MASIGSLFARNNIVNVKEVYDNGYQPPFWNKRNGPEGYYADLNGVVVPSIERIQQFQLSKVQQFEKEKVKEQKFQELNGIASTAMSTLYNIAETKQDQELQKAIANFIAATSGLTPRNAKPITQLDYQQKQLQFQKLEIALQNLINVAKANNNIVLQTDLQQIQEAAQACEIQPFNAEKVYAVMNRMWQLQGEVVEEAGVAWLNSLKLPNIQTIRTGNISLRTEKADRHSGSIIQDMMSIIIDEPDLLDTTIIEYIPIGSTTKKFEQHSLKEFLDHIEKHSGDTKQIILNDVGYSNLLSLRQISVQAKSGFSQTLWNPNAEYLKFTINDFSPQDGLAVSVHHTFELLHSLDLERPKDIWVKNKSKDYNLLANYGLGTILIKLLHLDAIEGNQFVLTPGGFELFSSRLAYLFKQYKYIAKIQSNVTINKDTMGHEYKATLQKP